MRGYDTNFVLRVRSARHITKEVRALAKACLRHPVPIATLSDLMGVSRPTLYSWLYGESVPNPRHLGQMQKVADRIASGRLNGK